MRQLCFWCSSIAVDGMFLGSVETGALQDVLEMLKLEVKVVPSDYIVTREMPALTAVYLVVQVSERFLTRPGLVRAFQLLLSTLRGGVAEVATPTVSSLKQRLLPQRSPFALAPRTLGVF